MTGFDALLSFDFSTRAGIVSGIFVMAVALKIASSIALRRERRRPFLPPLWNAIGWWTTKVSALVACASAFVLCRCGHDVVGEGVFAVLLVLAIGAVGVRAAGRRR